MLRLITWAFIQIFDHHKVVTFAQIKKVIRINSSKLKIQIFFSVSNQWPRSSSDSLAG